MKGWEREDMVLIGLGERESVVKKRRYGMLGRVESNAGDEKLDPGDRNP